MTQFYNMFYFYNAKKSLHTHHTEPNIIDFGYVNTH